MTSIEEAKRELRRRTNINELGGVSTRADRKITKENTEMLGATLSTIVENNNNVGSEVESKLNKVMENTATIKFQMPPQPNPVFQVPEIKIPEIKVPEVKVNIPEIKVPKAEVEVKIPEIKMPTKQTDKTNALLEQLISEIKKPCEINLILE